MAEIRATQEKIAYLGYEYSETLKCYTTIINGIPYSVFGKKLTLKGLLQQHYRNLNHNKQWLNFNI